MARPQLARPGEGAPSILSYSRTIELSETPFELSGIRPKDEWFIACASTWL